MRENALYSRATISLSHNTENVLNLIQACPSWINWVKTSGVLMLVELSIRVIYRQRAKNCQYRKQEDQASKSNAGSTRQML